MAALNGVPQQELELAIETAQFLVGPGSQLAQQLGRQAK
jgi:hypothetical protein